MVRRGLGRRRCAGSAESTFRSPLRTLSLSSRSESFRPKARAAHGALSEQPVADKAPQAHEGGGGGALSRVTAGRAGPGSAQTGARPSARRPGPGPDPTRPLQRLGIENKGPAHQAPDIALHFIQARIYSPPGPRHSTFTSFKPEYTAHQAPDPSFQLLLFMAQPVHQPRTPSPKEEAPDLPAP